MSYLFILAKLCEKFKETARKIFCQQSQKKFLAFFDENKGKLSFSAAKYVKIDLSEKRKGFIL